MNLASVDLNLLEPLIALLEERSVTRAAIRTQRQRGSTLRDGLHHLPTREIPDAQAAVISATRESLSVSAERQGIDFASVTGERLPCLSAGNVPYPDGAVIAGADHTAAVRRE